MTEENEFPEIHVKKINNVEISNLEIAKIAMVCNYLVLDRFTDISSFPRFEVCFGPLFNTEKPNFLFEVFTEICGLKKKYITYGRLILAYINWKSKASKNENFNKFMDILFNKMIKTKDEVIGVPIEGGRAFSTRNAKGRKIISKFGVLSDENKNAINGFYIQYDEAFDSVLSTKKIKEGENNDIKLEINFKAGSNNIKDRDGISHIGGKYSKTKNIIKFLIFKCRSGKTFYIGDNTEEENEEIEPFLLGTSSCQLKSLRIELVKDQLIYLEPKFQPSIRINTKIIPFDLIDDKFITNNIIKAPLIFEENEIKNIPLENLIETNNLAIPCISDDAFIDKKDLYEPIAGKDFNELYKSFIVTQTENNEKEKEDLKKEIFEKTVQRKLLLKVYLNKFNKKESIDIVKERKQSLDGINMDKFLAKVRGYRKKMDEKIKEKKEQLKMEVEYEDDEEDDYDWVEDKYLNEEN